MAYALSSTELEIEAEMLKAFKEQEVEDEGEASEENPEDEAITQELHKLMEAITAQFKFIDRVNPANSKVQKLIALADCNSWTQFQKERMDYLLEYMDASAASEPVMKIMNEPETKDAWKKKKLQTLQLKLQKQIAELAAKQDAKRKRLFELRTSFIRAKQRYLVIAKRARLSDTLKEEVNDLKIEIQAYIDEQNELALEDYTTDKVELEHQEIIVNAQLRFLENIEVGKFSCYINTSDSKWNCNRYNSLAEDCAFEYSFTLDNETEWLEKLATERYTPHDSERLDAKEMNETESYTAKRLRETRDKMGMIQEFFQELEYSYAINEELFMSENEGQCPLYKRKKDPRPHRWLTLEERVRFLIEKKESNGGYATLSDDNLFVAPF